MPLMLHGWTGQRWKCRKRDEMRGRITVAIAIVLVLVFIVLVHVLLFAR
jgi:hypothetical protein